MTENRQQTPPTDVEARIFSVLRARTGRDCFSRTAIAVASEGTNQHLPDLLLRCRMLDEISALGKR
jgi:hypothetical protein